MEGRRKAIYILLASALLINAGLAFYQNGLTRAPAEIIGNLFDGEEEPFEIPQISGGSVFVSRNTLNITVSRGPSESGNYRLEAIAVNGLYGDAYRQETKGDYWMTYSSPGNPAISMEGGMERTRTINLPAGGSPGVRVRTGITVKGPSGPATGLSTDVDLRSHIGTWTDLAWMEICPLMGPIEGPSGGETTLDLTLDEMGVFLDDASVTWQAEVLGSSPGRTMTVIVEMAPFRGMTLTVGSVFEEGVPWPVSYDLIAEGSYPTDEGDVEFRMVVESVLIGKNMGQGDMIPWDGLLRDISGPGPLSSVPSGDVPAEGGPTDLRFSPEEALETAMAADPNVRDFLREEPDVSFSSLSYNRNETRGVDSAVWNITLTSSRSATGGHPAMRVLVSAPIVGGKLDLDRSTLLSASATVSQVAPTRGRGVITLNGHESVLRSSQLAEHIFINDQYAPSYELHIMNRENPGSTAYGAMLFSVAGLSRARAEDLFVSYVQDRMDPKVVRCIVIDGSTGSILSMAEVSGGWAFIGLYGTGLA